MTHDAPGHAAAPQEAVLVVGAEPAIVRNRVTACLHAAGWLITSDDSARSDSARSDGARSDGAADQSESSLTLRAERGSLRRTVLLGALAGRSFHLTSTITMRRLRGGGAVGRSGTELVYRWGPNAGLILGGVLGRGRAVREHEQAVALIEQRLTAEGLSVLRRS